MSGLTLQKVVRLTSDCDGFNKYFTAGEKHGGVLERANGLIGALTWQRHFLTDMGAELERLALAVQQGTAVDSAQVSAVLREYALTVSQIGVKLADRRQTVLELLGIVEASADTELANILSGEKPLSGAPAESAAAAPGADESEG